MIVRVIPVVATLLTASVGAPAATDARYAGDYQLAPHAILRIWREDGHWYAQLTGQPRIEIIQKTNADFAVLGVAAEIVFRFDANGNPTGLILKQAGRDLPANRIDEAPAPGAAPSRTWTEHLASPPRILSSGEGSDYWPCFSPDGRSVIFAHTTDGRRWTLMRVPTIGGPAEPVARTPLPVSATRPVWSATAGLIAFTAIKGARNEVWVMRPDGREARKVAATGLSDQLFYPSWYPDGRRLVAMDARDNVIRRFEIDGGPATAMTNPAQVLAGMPSVSPDGRWIVFAGQKNQGQPYDQNGNAIWLVDPDGASRPLEATPLQGRAPVWSPDGSRLAFESNRGSPDGRYAIFVIAKDGSALTRVTSYDLNATHPVWSPDGKSLVLAIKTGPSTRIALVDLVP